MSATWLLIIVLTAPAITASVMTLCGIVPPSGFVAVVERVT